MKKLSLALVALFFMATSALAQQNVRPMFDNTPAGGISTQAVDSGTKTLPTRGSIIKSITGTITYGQTTYGANVGVGALVTVATGLPSGTVFKLNRLTIKQLTSLVTTPQTLSAHLFELNPTASTFSDNVAVSLNAADLAKCINGPTANSAQQFTGGQTMWQLVTPAGIHQLTADPTGNFYFALSNATASLVFASTGTLAYRAEISY